MRDMTGYGCRVQNLHPVRRCGARVQALEPALCLTNVDAGYGCNFIGLHPYPDCVQNRPDVAGRHLALVACRKHHGQDAIVLNPRNDTLSEPVMTNGAPDQMGSDASCIERWPQLRTGLKDVRRDGTLA